MFSSSSSFVSSLVRLARFESQRTAHPPGAGARETGLAAGGGHGAPGHLRLDESGGLLGMGRSKTFPFPQWRAPDPYRTVYFDHGAGQALVFVHGLGGNATHWEHVVAALERPGRRLVGLDLVGCGASLKPDCNYSLKMLRDHLLAFLDSRGIEQALLVGHSLGGAVCLAAAAARPGLAAGLILVGAAGVAPLPRWMHAAGRIFLRRELLYPVLILGHDWILRQVFVQGAADNSYVHHFREMALRDEPGLPNFKDFIRVCESLCRDVLAQDLSPLISGLQLPILAIWGDRDHLTPLPEVARSLSMAHRAQLVVLERCGHMPMVERPEDVVAHIERFLENTP